MSHETTISEKVAVLPPHLRQCAVDYIDALLERHIGDGNPVQPFENKLVVSYAVPGIPMKAELLHDVICHALNQAKGGQTTDNDRIKEEITEWESRFIASAGQTMRDCA